MRLRAVALSLDCSDKLADTHTDISNSIDAIMQEQKQEQDGIQSQTAHQLKNNLIAYGGNVKYNTSS